MVGRLTAFENELNTFRAALAKSENESLNLSRRLLEIEMLLNNRSTAIASVREKLDTIAAATAEAQPAAAESQTGPQAATLLHFSNLYHQRLGRGRHQENPDQMNPGRDGSGDFGSVPMERPELPDHAAASAGTANPPARETPAKIDSQTKRIEMLEQQLKAGQTAAQRRIDALESELHRERLRKALEADRSFGRTAR